MITFIHTGDIHYDKDTQALSSRSLEATIAAGAEKQIDFWALGGDLFNRGVQASDPGGLNRLKDLIQRMLDIAPIAAVSGTVTHDIPGCYRVFEDMVGKGGARFHLLVPETPLFLDTPGGRVMVLGCPEPQRSALLAGHEGLSGDEADAVIRAGVRATLTGMGTRRAEHPQLPCTAIYHGQVRGAAMANGELAEGGIAIGAEDLALIGADYYALDDIHLAQQIGGRPEDLARVGIPQQITGFPAFYSGSVYPVNWGETDTKTMNLVQMDDTHTQAPEELAAGPYLGHRFPSFITRLPYGHAPRKKLSLTWPEVPGDEVEGFQVWVDWRATEEQAKHLSEAALSEAIIEQEALPGSRVTVTTINVEATRSQEITEQDTLRKEVVIAARALGKPEPAESVLQKADQLELEGRKEGIGIIRRDIQFIKSRIRGHRAFQKRWGAEEMVLDLSKYGPGVIPLIAPNGTGKTTLEDNCHPFLNETAPGRDGGLKDCFYLRDSARETFYKEMLAGDRIRSLIEIDGANKSGGVTPNLFIASAGAEEVNVTNGRQKEYMEKVTSIFGTESMYVRMGFWMQEPSTEYPRLRRATKGKAKEIFTEFVGIGHYKVYSKKAGDKRSGYADDAARFRLAADTLQRQADELPAVRTEHVAKTAALDAQRVTVAGILERGKRAKAELDILVAAVKAQDMAEASVKTANEQRTKQQQIIKLAEVSIVEYTTATSGREVAHQAVTAWEKLKAEEAVENGKRDEDNKERDRRRTAYATVLAAHNTNVRTLENQKSGLRTESATMAGNRKALQKDIAHLDAELATPADENCPTCKRLLPEGTRKTLEEMRVAKEEKLAQLRVEDTKAAEKITALNAQAEAIVVPPAPPESPAESFDETEAKRIKTALAAIDIDAARKTLTTAAEAEARLQETRKQKTAAELEIARLTTVVMKLEATIDAGLKGRHDEKAAERERLLAEYNDANARLSGLQTLVMTLAERIARLETMGEEIAGHRADVEKAEVQAEEWRFLEWICGPDGIPVLKLDALGPSITTEANKLLDVLRDYDIDNHYDAVKFETQRDAKNDGHKIEDFTILCHDAKHGDWVDFARLSVGEAVWIDRAMTGALGIVREHNQGTRLLVVFMDESDAALDSVARRAFFALLQAEHNASGRYQTIAVTHSAEAQEMFPQRIYLKDLVVGGTTAELSGGGEAV